MTFDWDLDNPLAYTLVTKFEYDAAFTYGDMRPKNTDRDKRELIRGYASLSFPAELPRAKWWAFRIIVQKDGIKIFDIENVPKLIIDSFCKKQIINDGSAYAQLGLFPDDTIDFVRMMQVGGTRIAEQERTTVAVYGFVG